jgi:hypothetical protein
VIVPLPQLCTETCTHPTPYGSLQKPSIPVTTALVYIPRATHCSGLPGVLPLVSPLPSELQSACRVVFLHLHSYVSHHPVSQPRSSFSETRETTSFFGLVLRPFHYVAQAGLKLKTLFPQSLKCWDYRHALPCPVRPPFSYYLFTLCLCAPCTHRVPLLLSPSSCPQLLLHAFAQAAPAVWR